MVHKRRPKYVQDLIDEVNKYLRIFNVKDANDSLFWFISDYLLKKKMYEGYNLYVDKYNPKLGKNVPMLAGSSKKDEYDYLQIW